MAKKVVGDPVPHEVTKREKGTSKTESGRKPGVKIKGDDSGPNYLLRSTGSCHDICKYGKPHTFPEKPWRPIRRASLTRSQGDQSLATVLACSGSRSKKPNQADRHGFFSSVQSCLSMKSLGSNASVSIDYVASVTIEGSPSAETSELMEPETSLRESASLNASESSNEEVSSHFSPYSCIVTESRVPYQLESTVGETLLDRVGPPVDASKTAELEVPESVQLLSNQRKSNSKQGLLKGIKFSAPLKLKRANIRTMPSVSPSQGLQGDRKTWNDQSRRASLPLTKIPAFRAATLSSKAKAATSNEGTEAVLIPATSSSSPEATLTQVTSRDSVMARHHSATSSSHEADDLYESGYTDSEANECSSMDSDLNEESGSRPRNLVELPFKEETSAAVKLKFRRGKVIEPQSENNGQRRLRFSRGGVLLDDGRGLSDLHQKNVRKRAPDHGVSTNGTKSGAEKVVLRHQDVQGKKDVQVLLNNVIEETASKLVKTRKSKVKALVGAFETVIYLQEGKRAIDRPSAIIS